MKKLILLTAVAFVVGAGTSACEKKGPMERAGEKVDHAVDTVKNGGKEPVSDKMEDAANDVRDGAHDAAKDLKKD